MSYKGIEMEAWMLEEISNTEIIFKIQVQKNIKSEGSE